MNDSPGGFIWYELMTSDSDAAATFYGQVMGWSIGTAADANPGSLDYRMIGRSDGGHAGGVLKLTLDMVRQGGHPTWLGYLHVNGVDAAVRSIVSDGGRLLMPPTTLPVGTIAMVTDPLGTAFYVMDPIPPAGRPNARSDVFDPVAVQRVRWNELASPDLARSKAFYADHFGFTFNETLSLGAMGDYCFIDRDGIRLGAIMQKPEHGPIASWLFYFGVASVAAAKAAIEAGGGRIVNGPHEVPGGSWIIVATDPQGASFGVVGPRGA